MLILSGYFTFKLSCDNTMKKPIIMTVPINQIHMNFIEARINLFLMVGLGPITLRENAKGLYLTR